MRPFLHVIAQWYRDPDPARHAEQAEAMRRQASDPLVASTAILAIGDGCPVQSIRIDHRPTFAELAAQGSTDTGIVNVLVNGDCCIDPADTHKLMQVGYNQVWCLSRRDNLDKSSQDVWAWRGRLDVPQATYVQGISGCDNRFAFDCAMTGRIPFNPSVSVAVHHLHQSGVRRADESSRLPKPYLFVYPTSIGCESRMEVDGDPQDRERLSEALNQKPFTPGKKVPVLAVQLGRIGDILNVIPVCAHLGIRHMMVGREFVSALAGQNYINGLSWPGDIEDLARAVEYARTIADVVLVPQLFGLKQPEGLAPRTRQSFVMDQWDRMQPGLGDQWGTLPLVFNMRDRDRERELVLHCTHRLDKRLLLVNTASTSSPYPFAGRLLNYLKRRWSDAFEILDLAYLRVPAFCDLLALYEIAAGLITTDTATLHLSRACQQLPVFQIKRSDRDGTAQFGKWVQSYEEESMDRVGEFLQTLDVQAAYLK